MNPTRGSYIFYWAAATALGWIPGAVIAIPIIMLYVFTPFRNSFFAFVLVTLVLALAGVLVGWAQWTLLLSDLLPPTEHLFPRWLLISGTMGIAAPFTCALTLRFPSALFVVESAGTRMVEFGSAWVINVLLISLGVGVAVGLPQWFILRQYIPQAHLWIYANILAAAVALVAFLMALILFQSDGLVMILSCCGLPAIFGAVSGWGLWRIVNNA